MDVHHAQFLASNIKLTIINTLGILAINLTIYAPYRIGISQIIDI